MKAALYTYCIVIPMYNEEQRFDAASLLAFANNYEQYYFVLANDGSTDGTLQKIENCALNSKLQNITVYSNPVNKGKGNIIYDAMQFSIEQVPAQWYGYWDADFATPIEGLLWFQEAITANEKLTMVIGSRFKRLGAVIERKTYRQLLGRVLATLISRKLHLPVYDTQCGAKMFHNKIAPVLFKTTFRTKWLFDVELLKRYTTHSSKQLVLETVLELPLWEWRHKSGSKITLLDFMGILIELLKI
jgi:dolichyl-phosphate beta-glucosyltransferase